MTSITALEPTESPTFVLPLSNVMARAGQKIKLECEVTGLPLPILTWTHNGKAVKETRELKVGNTFPFLFYPVVQADASGFPNCRPPRLSAAN